MLVRDLVLDILEAVVGGRPEVEEGLLDDADHVGGRLQVRRVGLQPVLELLYRLAPVSWLGGRICNSEQNSWQLAAAQSPSLSQNVT